MRKRSFCENSKNIFLGRWGGSGWGVRVAVYGEVKRL